MDKQLVYRTLNHTTNVVVDIKDLANHYLSIFLPTWEMNTDTLINYVFTLKEQLKPYYEDAISYRSKTRTEDDLTPNIIFDWKVAFCEISDSLNWMLRTFPKFTREMKGHECERDFGIFKREFCKLRDDFNASFGEYRKLIAQ